MKKIWRIDVHDRDLGYSFSVKTDLDNEEDVINAAADADLFSYIEDAEYSTAENITDDEYELSYWEKCAQEI